MPIKKGKIPTKEEVMEIKKKRFLEGLEKEFVKDIPQAFHDIAKDVSALSNKEGVISHLLYKLLGEKFFEVRDVSVKSEYAFGGNDSSSSGGRFERRDRFEKRSSDRPRSFEDRPQRSF